MYLLCFRNFSVGVLLAALGLLAACDADSKSTDGWGSDASVSPTDGGIDSTTARVGRVIIVNDVATTGLGLVPGEVLPVNLLLTEANSIVPVGNARVEVALIGQAMNSTASVLVDYTDERGFTSFYLQAGSVPTQFQLRITAGVIEVYVPITVVDAQSAPLGVSVEGPMDETLTDVMVKVYANRTCASISAEEPASAIVAGMSTDNTAIATATLYAGADYAVAVAAKIADGSDVRGCIDGATYTTYTTSVSVVP